MARHYAPGDESPFLKRVLIPFWVIRVIIMGIDILAYGLVIGVLAAYNNNTGNMQDKVNGQLEDDPDWSNLSTKYNVKSTINAAIAISSVIMVLILICLVLDIVCIFKRSRRSLTPRFFLIVNVVQTIFWTVMFVLGFFGARTAFSTVLSIIPYLSFVGLLIYASIIFHKSRTGKLGHGKYAPAENAGGQLLAENTSYAGMPGAGVYAQSYPAPSYGPRDGQHHEMSHVPGGQSYGQSYYDPSHHHS